MIFKIVKYKGKKKYNVDTYSSLNEAVKELECLSRFENMYNKLILLVDFKNTTLLNVFNDNIPKFMYLSFWTKDTGITDISSVSTISSKGFVRKFKTNIAAISAFEKYLNDRDYAVLEFNGKSIETNEVGTGNKSLISLNRDISLKPC